MPDQLTINWPYLLMALTMLWFPRQWLRTGARVLKKRRKPDGALERLAGMGARDLDDRSVQPGREFANFRNYIDLFRALAGGYSLSQFAFTAGNGEAGQSALIAQAAVLLVAVLIQSVRFDGRLSFFAPIFYFVGMSVGACGHYTGLFAFALVLAINPIIPNPHMFLTAYGLLLLSLLSKRPLVIFTKKAKTAATPS